MGLVSGVVREAGWLEHSLPRFWMPMTQGEAAAPAAPLSMAPMRRVSRLEQMIPTHRAPRT